MPATTPIVVFTDDDHLVTNQTRLPELVATLNKHHDLDLLAALSNNDERPRLMRVDGKILRIRIRTATRQHRSIRWCHYVGNCFVAYRDILQAIRWDESLKVEEHWDFFWRAKIAGMNVAVDINHSFKHEHVDPPGYVRRRPEFLECRSAETRTGKGDVAMIEIPALEYHLAHGCNLSCQQCSHYSNFRLAGKLPTPDDARREYSLWSHRIQPRRFALLGGEPLLNPHLIEHLRLALASIGRTRT